MFIIIYANGEQSYYIDGRDYNYDKHGDYCINKMNKKQKMTLKPHAEWMRDKY